MAVSSAGSAEPIIIGTGEPVMALGGFSGSDPIVTDAGLGDLVRSGRIRFFLVSGPGGTGFRRDGGAFGSGGHVAWITTNCAVVDDTLWSEPEDNATDGRSSQTAGRSFPGGPIAGNYSLYDCAAG